MADNNENGNGNGNGNGEYRKTMSRKWKLVLLILLVATIGTFAPPLISAWIFGATTPLAILTGGNFVTLITLIVSAYFGANVWQKHVLKGEVTVADESEKGKPKKTTTTTTTTNESETKIEPNEQGEA